MKYIKNYLAAMKLVGGYHTVSGTLRTISTIAGFVGIMALVSSPFFIADCEKYSRIIVVLAIVFAIMCVLPLYYPRKP